MLEQEEINAKNNGQWRLLREADLYRNYRKIQLKYFEVTFYKKGTCHLTFTNERLLKKFNIFGSQGKHWLPYDYGKRRYEEMSAEEQTVIESFEGRESYNETLQESQYYLCGSQVLMLSAEWKKVRVCHEGMPSFYYFLSRSLKCSVKCKNLSSRNLGIGKFILWAFSRIEMPSFPI